MKKILLVVAALAAISGAAAAKNAADSTAVFTVQPKMSCANCEKKIKSNLRFEKGIKNIVTSLPDQTVTVTFDPAKTNSEAISKGFAKIGYKATRKDK